MTISVFTRDIILQMRYALQEGAETIPVIEKGAMGGPGGAGILGGGKDL